MAAVDADDYLPFDAGIGADRLEDGVRKLFGAFQPSGVLFGELNSCSVFADGTGSMQTFMRTGNCLLEGHYGTFTSQKTALHANPHATQDRIDRVVLRADRILNKVQVDVLKGVEDGSLTPPSVTQDANKYELSIARVSIANAGAPYAIDASSVVDTRRFTVDVGPVCRVATSSTVSTLVALASQVSFTGETFDPDDMFNLSLPQRVTIAVPGLYRVVGGARWAAGGTGERLATVTLNGSNTEIYNMVGAAATIEPRTTCSGLVEAAAGDFFGVSTYQTSGGAQDRTSASLSVQFVAPLVSTRLRV